MERTESFQKSHASPDLCITYIKKSCIDIQLLLRTFWFCNPQRKLHLPVSGQCFYSISLNLPISLPPTRMRFYGRNVGYVLHLLHINEMYVLTGAGAPIGKTQKRINEECLEREFPVCGNYVLTHWLKGWNDWLRTREKTPDQYTF